MKKGIFAAMAVLMIGTAASAQTITVYGNDDTVLSTFKKEEVKRIVFEPEGEVVGEAVDLGLSVKWASYNVGASSPEEYGGYYAWGETNEKSDYSEETYFDPNYTITTDIAGTEYDVAHVKLGGSWRMPRLEEIKELVNKCTWQWTKVNGVAGQKVTGPNGNSIFLPAAGYRDGTSLSDAGIHGCCWSSAPYVHASNYAYDLFFYSGGGSWNDLSWRGYGFSVRPVSE